jgi:hypothetical protein
MRAGHARHGSGIDRMTLQINLSPSLFFIKEINFV